jgi:hypothetical protein
MYGQAEGYIAPCLYGIKETESAYILYSEGAEDVLVHSRYISKDLASRGGKIRLFGMITSQKGFKEMSVERIMELN